MKIQQIFPLKNGFETEKLRKKLLSQKKYLQLLSTYFRPFPEITDFNSPDFWDEKFENEVNTNSFYMTTDRNSIVTKIIKKNCEKNLKDKQLCKILNIGAGSGQLEKIATQKIREAISWIGTDFTQMTLNRLKEKYPKFTFVKTGIIPLPFAENTFDTVCLLEVLEHIQPQKNFAVLKEIYRVTKTGGTVIISVPINEGLEQMMPNNPNSHVRVYSKELLSFELTVSGFKINKVFSLTAFNSLYSMKKLINSILKMREPNNLIFVLEKK